MLLIAWFDSFIPAATRDNPNIPLMLRTLINRFMLTANANQERLRLLLTKTELRAMAHAVTI